MHGNENIFTREKTISSYEECRIGKSVVVDFKKRKKKPNDIEPYIDFENGWKLKEDDKDFLISFYDEWIRCCIEEFGGDFIEEPTKILNSIKKKGVKKSKTLIQENAREISYAVCDNIYEYYADSPETLKLIENSILNINW